MFERRPIWGILIGLTICISIWRISIQEPSMLAAEYGYTNGGGGIIIDGDGDDESFSNLLPKNEQQQQIYGGKRLLVARKTRSEELNDIYGTDTEIVESKKFKFNKNSKSNSDVVVDATNISSKNVSYETSYNLKKISTYNRKLNKTLNEFQRGAAVIAAPSPPPPPVPIAIAAMSRKHRNRKRNSVDKATPKPPQIVAAITLASPTTKSTVAAANDDEKRQPRTADDFQQLIDVKNFDYIMRQPDCDAHILAPILVHSAPANFHKRQIIRTTWGSAITTTASAAATATATAQQENSQTLRVIFLLGAVANTTLQRQLQHENSLYGDMVQGNFMDDYKNMTYKHIMAFKWFVYSCANAQILIKVDDDVFVNTPQLLTYILHGSEDVTTAAMPPPHGNLNSINHPSNTELSRILFHHPKNLLFCQEVFDARVKRSYRSKWRVSVREFSGHLYPPYCPGYSIIYSADVVQRLYSAAQKTKYFWIDDVHVTGTLAQQLNMTKTSSLPYMLTHGEYDDFLANKIALADLEFIFAWADLSGQQINQLWKLLNGNTDLNPVLNSTEGRYLSEGFR